MPEYDISQASKGDMTNDVKDVTVDTKETDGATGDFETSWQNADWSEQLGYYLTIPELKRSIDTRAMWVTGRGIIPEDDDTKIVLERIRGAGDDTILEILTNMITIKRVAGDAYAEIIRDKNGVLLNIKPLDPSSIKIVVDSKGMLKRYEQTSRTPRGKTIKFKPTDIFRLTNKRIADSIHGISDIDVVKRIVKARNESFTDSVEIQHRFARPRFIVQLDTDKEAEINAFIKKFDAAINKGENVFVPKGTVQADVLAVPPNSTLNSQAWRNELKDYFSQAVGTPQIVMDGSGQFTESGGKMAFMGYEQGILSEKLATEQQFSRQVFYNFKFADSVSLRPELQQDNAKDGANAQMDMQAGEIAPSPAGVEE